MPSIRRGVLLGLAASCAAILALTAQDSAGTPNRAVLTGRVQAEGGKALVAADVVVDSAWHARTDPSGTFRLAGIPLGSHLMEVRAIGYEPLAIDVRLDRATPLDLTITLKAAAQRLPEVVVKGRQQRLTDAGYYARRQTGQGRFVEGDSLAGLDSVNFMRAITQLPGINRLNPGSIDQEPRSISCRRGFNLVLNGWLVETVGDIPYFVRTLHPTDVDAIEIYEDAGIPDVHPEALQSPGAPRVSAGGAVARADADWGTISAGAAGSPGRVSATPRATTVTAALQRAAFRWQDEDRNKDKPTPTSCTLVVWERE